MQKDVFTDEVLKVYADTFRPKGAITPPIEYYRNMDRNWELPRAVRRHEDRGALPDDLRRR